ncbi:MAG: N-acetyltransferase [Alphaproteobacteria bacterium]|nr:MAG: N-acetyltransferase [Alphaproteobacteria bacterium]
MTPAPTVEIALGDGVAAVDAATWDAFACPEAADGGPPADPFTTHRFLSALEHSGSVGPGTGWTPRPLIARRGGQVIGVAPLYLKSHSQGEYIFDHAWAHAYEAAGGRYYPKLQVAVPFTPATGRRLLVRPEDPAEGRAALLAGLSEVLHRSGLSSAHVTFCTAEEAEAGEAAGFLRRTTEQFHWENPGYASFDDFLAALSSRKRKMIRKERAAAAATGLRFRRLEGDALRPEHWDAFWRFYQDTGARKWGRPYLTREFFDIVHQTMRNDVLLVVAERDGTPIAGALNFKGRDTLFGRYWGAVERHPFLHFELCYYQAMDHAIAQGLSRVEAGAQGEHKIARGYLPREIHSLHEFADRTFRHAVADYLEAERRAVREDLVALADHGPFRHIAVEEQE